MPRKVDVTETELRILDVLWEAGPSIVREIVEQVYGEHSPSLHATVKSLLDRLAEKGLVAQDGRHHAHRYSASVAREAFIGEQLQQLADHHFGGSLAPVFLTLLERVKLSQKQRDAIRQIIKRLE